MPSYDAIVIGAGVIGSSVAYHLARFGAGRVLVLERLQIGAGTTTQSSGILRTHYSVIENVELARQSWSVFTDCASWITLACSPYAIASPSACPGMNCPNVPVGWSL